MKMKLKILNILVIFFLIINLSFVGAETLSIQEASCGTSPSYINSPCETDANCACNIHTCGCVLKEYEKNVACLCGTQPCETGEERCACVDRICKSVPKTIEVDYNEEFTLVEGQRVIIPGRYFITLEDIELFCVACRADDLSCHPRCDYRAKLWYFTRDPGHTFYMEEGDRKEFGEKAIFKLLKMKKDKAIFIVYPIETEEKRPIITWIVEEEKVEVMEKCKDSCFLNDACVPIGYRISNKYCSINGDFKYQKQEDENCNNNFECQSNICIDNKCVSSSLIQKIINFFKKLFGL